MTNLLMVSGVMGRLSRTIYVGNLPGDTREREVEDLFYKVTFSFYEMIKAYLWS